MKEIHLKFFVSLVGFLLLSIHLFWPSLEIDAIALGLSFFATLPWLSSMLETAELPGGWKVKFRKLEQQQKEQKAEIATLKFLVSHFVTEDELQHLRRLASSESFTFRRDDTSAFFEKELRRLRAFGLIDGYPEKGIRTLFKEGGDVREHFYVTRQGEEYLKLREDVDFEAE